MTTKLLGAAFMIVGSGIIGRLLIFSKRKEIKTTQELILLLDNLACELQYRITPLPELCNIVCNQARGSLKELFTYFAEELNNQIMPNAQICMDTAIKRTDNLPDLTKSCVELLGQVLGHYELEGQLKGIQSVREECIRAVNIFSEDVAPRLRCYQSLSLCAGAALAILLM